MGTELRVLYAEIPPGRSIGPDMFADLGATATLTRDEQTLVITLDVDLSPEDERLANLRLTTRDDDTATTVLALSAAAGAITPTGTTEERLAALEDAVTKLAALVVGNRATP